MLSEASYVYILSGQKLIENAKNGLLWRDFENLGQTVLPERVLFSFQTILEVRVPKCSPISLHEKCFTKSVSKWP